MAPSKTSVLPLVLGRDTASLPYLAMGMLTAYLKTYQGGQLADSYTIDPLLPAGYGDESVKLVYERVVQTHQPICLFSSYVWNHTLNLRVAERVRALSPDCLIIFGGPHVPKYTGETEKFLQDNAFIDIAVLGEGEACLAEILAELADSDCERAELSRLSTVPGLVYSDGEQCSRTAERNRIRDIAELPSPYLSGEFEPWFENFPTAILETNRGCPFGCTYCDWGSATLAKVTKFTPERVVAEIKYIASRKPETIFIADANFGSLEQDVEIAQALVDVRAATGYPKRLFTNFAKNGGRRLMTVTKILHEGGLLPSGIIALQSTDPTVLKTIARDNIRTQAYETMMTYFNSENIPMASDLMIGLPGQTVDSFANDLQFCFNWKVAAAANYTSMMPNAPMAEKGYREQYQIETDKDDIILSTSSFSAKDMAYMKKLFTTYQFHVRFGISKYILYYLQIEHGIEAIPFLRRWLRRTLDYDNQLPISVRIFREILLSGSRHGDWAVIVWGDNAQFLFDNPEDFYEEVLDFAEREFDISVSPSERETLKAAQQAVIPRVGRRYPYEIALDHDFEAYVKQIKNTASVTTLNHDLHKLSEFKRGTLTVTHDAPVIDSIAFTTPANHSDEWELASPLRFY